MQKTLTKIVLTSLFLIQAYAFQGFAQAPNQFSYQAVIRDANGLLVENKPVSIKISILSGTANGVAIFQEEHTDTTNSNGLITIAIGSKVAFNIDWSKGPFFIKTELKKSGEANFVDFGTTQMLSVPYALYAEKSGSSNVPGPAGKDGTNGKDGVDGKDGAVGPIGPKGDTGAVGPQGPAGLPGKDGMNGKDGVNGVDGKEGAVGPIGPKGDTGAVGPQGPAGLPGKDGMNGKDGVNGVDGKEGAVGPIGPKGDTGAVGLQGPADVPGKDGINGKDGVDGKDGAVGPIGPKGDTGAVGQQGPAGVPGKDGMNGKDGVNGVDGKDGINGKDGVDGKDGKVEFQNLRVSETGDTLYLTNGNYIIMPGISAANKTTPKPINYGQSIADADGNTYKTIIIGQQEWMAENLKTTKYSNGDIIPNITDAVAWNKLNYGAWSYYNNEKVNDSLHGKLYNFYAVTNPKNVCPTGWHVPTLNELYILTDEIAKLAPNNVGGSLKSKDKSWINNENATNLIGFNAMASGYRANYGGFDKLGENFWMHTIDGHNPVHRNLLNAGDRSNTVNPTVLFGYYNYFTRETGASIRCVKGESTYQYNIGLVDSVECDKLVVHGKLTASIPAKDVSIEIPYKGGNGGFYGGRGSLTGFSIFIEAGNFAYGDGIIKYDLTGTPTMPGFKSYSLKIGGKICDFKLFVDSVKLGSSVGGGVVAYVFKEGDPGYVAGETHGIILSPADLKDAPWGCIGKSDLSFANKNTIGSGKQNTLDIITNCKDTISAAYLCSNLNINGFNDWFLPSGNELKAIYDNRNLIPSFNIGQRGYWSSTYGYANIAYGFLFDTGTLYDTNTDHAGYGVRAIRYF